MEKKNEYRDIERLKAFQLGRIRQQEQAIKLSFKEVRDNITGEALKEKLKENLFSGPGLAFKLGYITVTLLQERFSKTKKK
ncbi:MAG TPA: hypothetical protein PLW31_14150 [Bacteroidales bacterium]|jgi:hypothetical protein|nr:hypothetical protein [Bacteroidales bacterium]MDX9905815.1 hypothetical protein [Bacteroidales bacterium]HNQ83613.1 hypothetical protein [Bacteroidales bacterium]HOX79168.1 hypothetical protein [Bacteroidales bacterium]HPI85002.1 hypothetical protein [Bacteroidales bacterium]